MSRYVHSYSDQFYFWVARGMLLIAVLLTIGAIAAFIIYR